MSIPARTVAFCGLFMLLILSSVHAAIPLGKDGFPTLAPLMKQVTPAVVNVATQARAMHSQNPLLRDPFFRRFFNLPDRMPSRPRMSAGSGVIVDAAEGYILTNHHVVEDAAAILVKLKDGREFEAELIGNDPGTDIALLKIDPVNLTSIQFGDSDQLEVGDFAVAIGNPFGLGQTVTSGIISALGRSGLNIEGYEDFIQTDASINPGNSGGALVNLKGELIGINTAIIAPSGGNVGIGFAVPSNIARSVMQQLLGYGEVRRGRLGVMIQDLTPSLASALGASYNEGVVVTQVEAGSSAEQAGLRAGDIIISVNERSVRNVTELRSRIGLSQVGETVELIVIREGQQLRISAQISELINAILPGGRITPALAGAQFKNHIDNEGVVVLNVNPGSPAARYGLREDDIILAVNRQRVRGIEDMKNILSEPTRVIAMNILRGSVELFIVIQ